MFWSYFIPGKFFWLTNILCNRSQSIGQGYRVQSRFLSFQLIYYQPATRSRGKCCSYTSPEQIKCVLNASITVKNSDMFMLQFNTQPAICITGGSDPQWSDLEKQSNNLYQTIVYVSCLRQSVHFERFEGHLTMKMLNLFSLWNEARYWTRSPRCKSEYQSILSRTGFVLTW